MNTVLDVDKKTGGRGGGRRGEERGKKETKVHGILKHSSQKQWTLTAPETLVKGRMVHKQNSSLHSPSPILCDTYKAGEMEASAPLFPLPSNQLVFKEERGKTVRARRGLRDFVTPIFHFRTKGKEGQRVEGACLSVSHFTRPCAAEGQRPLCLPFNPPAQPGPRSLHMMCAQ